MEKIKMQSENLVDENVEKIGKLFPNCITEGKDENGQTTKFVDFDMLKQELSKVVVDGNDERYMLNWAGKKQSILTANSPINATLRPCEEESVGKDGKAGGFDSENLYIEGDNLDVLKLLRETYLNKIKMIYIDPPYNTGNDFVYNDDFATSAEEYLQNSKSYDEEGNRMVQNLNSSGRFHSDWLSMMYPRLKLARDLLTDDGVIFISIDDNEQANLKKICDEIFGENNFIGTFIINSTPNARDYGHIGKMHEFALFYSKNILLTQTNLLPEENKVFKYNDDKGGYNIHPLYNSNETFTNVNRPNLYYPFYLYLDKPLGNNFYQIGLEKKDNSIEIYPPKSLKNNIQFVWRWGKDKALKNLNEEIVGYKVSNDEFRIVQKMRHDEKLIRSLLLDNKYSSRRGTAEVEEMFKNKSFSFPKPINLIYDFCKVATNKGDIVLDFFSGSATTAHAVMQLNAEDGGNRKFIMVQLPEKTDEKSEAYKAGYKNICEIGKERIRRAGKKIVEEQAHLNTAYKQTKLEPMKPVAVWTNSEEQIKEQDKVKKNLDIGFRVLKLDSSNMKDVYYNPADISQDLLSQLESNIKEDRSSLDLLFQVMLDMGVMLSQKIEKRSIQGKTVYIVGEYDEENQPNLICCFDDNISEDVVTEIAKLKPIYAVFRDSSMSTDSMSVNFDQIFATHSPNTTRKVL